MGRISRPWQEHRQRATICSGGSAGAGIILLNTSYSGDWSKKQKTFASCGCSSNVKPFNFGKGMLSIYSTQPRKALFFMCYSPCIGQWDRPIFCSKVQLSSRQDKVTFPRKPPLGSVVPFAREETMGVNCHSVARLPINEIFRHLKHLTKKVLQRQGGGSTRFHTTTFFFLQGH